MKSRQRIATTIPPLFDLRMPSTQPITPEPKQGLISEKELTTWYATVLEWNLKQMEQGDADAWEWANAIDRHDPFSYLNLCEFFKVDPFRMHEAIKALLGSGPPLKGRQEERR